MTSIVFDTSAGAGFVINRTHADFFRNVHLQADWVIAPSFYVVELTNVMWKYQRAGLLDKSNCKARIDQGIRLINSFEEACFLWKDAFSLSIEHEKSTYDMFYLALAIREKATLVTNDKTLARLADSIGVDCQSPFLK